MKSIILISFIFLGFGATAQNDKGLWSKVGTTVNYVNVAHTISDPTLPSTARYQIDGRSHNEHVGIGGRVQLGYRINKKWSTGIQTNVFLSGEQSGFFPTLLGYSQFGGFGVMHLNDRFDIEALMNYTVMNRSTNGLSFGLAPQLAIGKSRNISIRASIEYFYAKTNVNYFAYDYDENMDILYYDGNAPLRSQGMLFELGIMFRI